MGVPFNIEKYEEDKIKSDLKRFKELFYKYINNIDEILEFVDLYNRLFPKKRTGIY